MTLKIYGTANSRAIRTLWAAEELGLDYEIVPLHYASDAVRSPAYLAINPNGTVPTIDDGEQVMFESLAINLYLAKKHAPRGLWVDSMSQEAQLLQWTLWSATEVEPLARQWFHHSSFLPPAERQPALAEKALEALQKRFRILDALFATGPYLVDGRFTVADLNLASVLLRFTDLGGGVHGHALDWHRRCMERPAARRAFALRQVA
ncbi:Glutathione S-transferase domain [Leptothrix cholodnii SP-6]|jgi:glutathione S-transferase|uniref:Glutathione S-transferase domain n=1 Tax=Leptothrix cholodnii (strain ATCC 51168 / LMG 8142 / SP-6) TaxID=395495 RepID=B1Y0C8_LEPCP|nr:glutathione S-transferase family protein [Leptothrix cholodnii]ACB36607.1 Glutathione S-transferase domain [Leptothrix cholodnii SP-6]